MIGAAWLGAPWFTSMGIEPVYALGVGVMLGGVLQLGVQAVGPAAARPFSKIGFNWAAVQAA